MIIMSKEIKYKTIRVNTQIYDLLKENKQYSGQSFNSMFYGYFGSKKKKR
jgi:predicted CopG family antitoxin